jgi:poly(A) polymerase
VEPPEDLLIRRDNVFGNAEEDARRRDFTINGLFYDLADDQVIDYVGGLADLSSRMVRTIGDPDVRFREDPVRILRAIKFAARLDFHIEPNAWRAITVHKGEIPKCPPPRVLEELYRLMRGAAGRRSMELLRDTGVMAVLVPELYALVAGPAADPTAVRWWWEGLDRLDARVRTGFVPSNAVLLCLLVGPFVGAEAFEDAEKVRDVGELIDDRIRPVLERMRVSRRDSERARQMLLAQRRIAPSKRRRGRPMALVRRDYFDEALAVYEVLGPVIHPEAAATEEELSRWHKMASSATHDGPLDDDEDGVAAAPGTPGEEPRRRRRRRRGGRKRRRGGGGGGDVGGVTAE